MKNRYYILALATALFCVAAAAGDGYPKKPITIICPFKAGGGADLILRPFESVAKKYINQPIVIVYKEGAGGVIGVNEVKKARPDGYTMGLAMSGAFSTQPVMTTVPYDPEKDFDYVGGINLDAVALVVQNGSPYKTLDEFVKGAGEGSFTWTCSTPGGIPHLAGELFLAGNGIKARMVPSSGGNEAIINLMGGHVDFAVAHPSEMHAGYLSGDLRILGVMSETRRKLIKEVPTFKELGYDIVVGVQRSFILPKGVDKDIVAKLNDLLQKIIADPDFRKAMDTASIEPEYITPEQARKRHNDDLVRFGKVVKDIGLR